MGGGSEWGVSGGGASGGRASERTRARGRGTRGEGEETHQLAPPSRLALEVVVVALDARRSLALALALVRPRVPPIAAEMTGRVRGLFVERGRSR